MILTLAEAKSHLRVTHDADDADITSCITDAEDYIAKFTGQAIPDPVPGSLLRAAKLLVGDFYENREAAGDKALIQNPAAERLMHFYRVGLGV